MKEKLLKILFISIIFPALTLILLVFITNRILPEPEFEHSMHFLREKFMNNHFERYFVEDEKNPQRVKLHPLIVKMDNRKISFKKLPSEKDYRIIAVGCSTTQGWPFHNEVSYTDFLTVFINKTLPDKSIEVINAGLNGADSLISISVMREIMNYNPSLIIVDVGNSENWSFQARIGPRAAVSMVQGFLRRNVRLYKYLEKMVPREELTEEEMSRAVREREEPDMDLLEELFRNNLVRLKSIADRNDIDIVFLTQVGIESEHRKRINRVIKKFSADSGAYLIDTASYLRGSGLEESRLLISDDMHTTPKGTLYMAESVIKGLKEKNIIEKDENWRMENLNEASYYLDKLDLDAEYYENISRRYGVSIEYMRESLTE